MARQAQVVINNMIAERLRSGSAQAVRGLRDFGIRPHMQVDDVSLSSGSGSIVRRHSAWFWSHQAPVADGIQVMWEMLDHQLQSSTHEERMRLLSERLREACQSSLSCGAIVPLEETWIRVSDWVLKEGHGRSFMVACLTGAVCALGDAAVSGLQALSDAGCVTRSDWSFRARQAYADDPLSSAMKSNMSRLAMLMLDLGCDPKMQDGTPVLCVAWSRLCDEVGRGALHVDGLATAADMVEEFLARDMDWSIAPPGSDKTIDMQARDMLPVLAASHRMKRVAAQVERRLLEQDTPKDLSSVRRPKQGRL